MESPPAVFTTSYGFDTEASLSEGLTVYVGLFPFFPFSQPPKKPTKSNTRHLGFGTLSVGEDADFFCGLG